MQPTSPLPETGTCLAQLHRWPAEAARQLAALIDAHAHSGAYAVFDADNTTYHHDLLGALLWLVNEEGAAFVTGTVIPVDGGFSSFSGV